MTAMSAPARSVLFRTTGTSHTMEKRGRFLPWHVLFWVGNAFRPVRDISNTRVNGWTIFGLTPRSKKLPFGSPNIRRRLALPSTREAFLRVSAKQQEMYTAGRILWPCWPAKTAIYRGSRLCLFHLCSLIVSEVESIKLKSSGGVVVHSPTTSIWCCSRSLLQNILLCSSYSSAHPFSRWFRRASSGMELIISFSRADNCDKFAYNIE